MMSRTLLMSVLCCCCGVQAEYLVTFPNGSWKVPEDTLTSLTLSLGFNASDLEGEARSEALLEVTVVADEDWKLDWVNRSAVFTVEEVVARVNKSVVFSGYYWGRSRLSCYLSRDDLHHDHNYTLLRDDLYVTVDRKSYTLDTIFIAVGSFFVLINNVNMGAQLDLQVIKRVLQRPLGPLCGFVSQFAIMPVATYVMGLLLFDDPLDRLGLFTLGCSPGGTSSNFWTLMFNGDINLSITMTLVSTVAAMGMMPLWMLTLGGRLVADVDITIPYGNLAGSLVALTLPISIGILIRIKREKWAEIGNKFLKPFSFFILLFFMGVGTYNSYKVILVMTWQMVVAGLLVVACGYSLGALFARLVCLPKAQIIAVSIETALQNPGVAFVLLKLSLESPYSDLAAVPVIATMFVSGPPLILTYLAYLAARRWCCPSLPPKEQGEVPQDSHDTVLYSRVATTTP